MRSVLQAGAATLLALGLLTAPAAALHDPGGVPPLVGDPAAAPSGEFRWPLAGQPAAVRAFDPPAHRYGRGHRGVDLAGVPGDPVFAAGPGIVIYAAPLAGRGVISISHPGGVRTTYEPVRAAVHAGQRVTAGQRIGVLAPGHPECAAAACLHWGARRDETYLNPLWLLRRGPLRLLPWDGVP